MAQLQGSPDEPSHKPEEELTCPRELGLIQYVEFTKALGLPITDVNIRQARDAVLCVGPDMDTENGHGISMAALQKLHSLLEKKTVSGCPDDPAVEIEGQKFEVKRLVKIAGEKHDYHLLGLHTRYSNWTARVVTVLEYFKIPYSATFINVHTPAGQQALKAVSPAGQVPLLLSSHVPGIKINDSLSILEFLAETNPHLPLWPRDVALRAQARSSVAEMHAGFDELRGTYGTNYVARYTGSIPMTDTGRREIERMLKLWSDSRRTTIERLGKLGEEDDGFLFGAFGIADSYFWPVLWRFRSYELPLTTATPEALAWMRKMWNDPVIKAQGNDYFQQLKDPATRIEKYDDIFSDIPDVQFGIFEEDWVFPH